MSGDAPRDADDFEVDLAVLLDASAAGAAAASARFRRGAAPDAEIWKKADDTTLTAADLAANDAVRESVRAARPDYGWLSEEEAPDAASVAAARLVVVDPIDGTAAFARGDPSYSICVGLADAGAPVAGVVRAPALDEVFAARRGGGATLNGAPIAVGARETLDGAVILSRVANLDDSHWRDGAPDVVRRQSPSIALRICRVAQGAVDAALTLSRTQAWDVAAAAAIAQEAGAIVTDRRGRPLNIDASSPDVDGLIAANPTLHAEILRRLKP